MEKEDNLCWIAVPVVLGLLSLGSFLLYFYSANHAPYRYTDVIFLCPVFSFVGVLVSCLKRKYRKKHPILWYAGLFLCGIGFIMGIAVLLLLVLVAGAMLRGDWL